jgi:hypothetical protein
MGGFFIISLQQQDPHDYPLFAWPVIYPAP